MSTEEIKIRPLKRKDRKTVAAMIRKLADKIGKNGLLNIIVSDPAAAAKENTATEKGDVFTRIGIEIVKQMLDVLEDDVAKWFADLIGKTPEQFDDLPFDVEVQIIEQLANSEEIGSFFTGALRVFNKIKKSVPESLTKKPA
jgi:hypothetical protein